MENVQLFNRFTDNAMKQDFKSMEIKEENKQDSLNTSEYSKCFMNEQSVLGKAVTTLDNTDHITDEALSVKQENSAQSVSDITENFEELNDSSKIYESISTSKSSDSRKAIPGSDKSIDIGRKERLENIRSKFVYKGENVSMVTCSERSKTEKRRRIDNILDKKFGNKSKKIKLPNEIIASVKNSIAINNKKNKQFFNIEKIASQKDDVYSFADEVISSESAEFSYQSFDKNVLHKRKSSAKLLSARRSTLDLNTPHHLKDSSDLNNISLDFKKGQDEQTTLLSESPVTTKEVPLLNFGVDFTNTKRAAEKGKLPESLMKDKLSENTKLSDHSSLSVKIDTFPTSFLCNDSCFPADLSRNFCNQLSCNKSTCSKGNSISADASHKSPSSGLHKFISQNISSKECFEKRADGYSQACEKSKRENIANNFDSENKSRNLKLTENVIFPYEKKDAEKKVVKVIESRTGDVTSIDNKNVMQKFPIETVFGPSKVCSVNGVSERSINLMQKVDRYSGMQFFRPPFNANNVNDKRLEAIRKVSMWIGDCMENAARNMDSPEDLSVDKIVPKAQGQTNGKCASLSETLRTSSVKTKCASINVECATSKALVKSKSTEVSKPTCKADKAKRSLNMNQKCKNVNVELNCQQNMKEIRKVNGFNVHDNSCLEIVHSKIKRSDTGDTSEKEAIHQMGNTMAEKCLKKSSDSPAMNGITKSMPSSGTLDVQFDTDSKEQCSSSFDQSLFNGNTELTSLDSKLLFISENSNLKEKMKIVQDEIKLENFIDKKCGDSKGLKIYLEENAIKDSTFGKDLRMRMSSNDSEQIKEIESACIDLSVKNLDEQSSYKCSGNMFVAENTVEDSYGAEVWGLGNDVYNTNENIVDVNDVTEDVACVDKSTSQVYCLINVKDVPDDVKCKPVNVYNVAKDNSLDNVAEISDLLETPGTYIECDSRGLERGEENKSNKIDVNDFCVDRNERGNNGVNDLTEKTVNIGDNSSKFDFTPEHFNLTYPGVVIDTNAGTQCEALDLHVGEHFKEFRLSSALPYVRCEPNQNSDLLNTNIAVSLPELTNVQSRATSAMSNKEKPKHGESQDTNGYVKIKSSRQTLVSNEASPHLPVVKPDSINRFSGHDWSADDLANLGLDNAEEDHSLENINPVSLIDCPVSIASGLISVNHDPVSGASNLVSSSSNAFSAGIDRFSNFYPVSKKGNLVSNDEKKLVSNICGSENQFPLIIGNERNQYSKGTDNFGKQFPNKEDNPGNQYPCSTDNAGNGNQFLHIADDLNQFPLDDLPQLIGEGEDYQWNETLKSFIMQNLDNEPKEENGAKEAAADVELLLEQKLAEQYLNRNIESLKRKHSID